MKFKISKLVLYREVFYCSEGYFRQLEQTFIQGYTCAIIIHLLVLYPRSNQKEDGENDSQNCSNDVESIKYSVISL